MHWVSSYLDLSADGIGLVVT